MIPVHLKIRLGIWVVFGLITLILISPLIPDELVLQIETAGVLVIFAGSLLMVFNHLRKGARNDN